MTIVRPLCRLPILLPCLVLTLWIVVGASVAGKTTVELSSGRRFSGEIDSKTDEQLLWLRFGSGSAVILRPIAWQHVRSAVHAEKELSANAFRSLALSLAADAADDADDADALPPPPDPAESELDDTPTDVAEGPMGLVGQPLSEIERWAIEQTLRLTNSNREETARILGIGARTLYRKLDKYKP